MLCRGEGGVKPGSCRWLPNVHCGWIDTQQRYSRLGEHTQKGTDRYSEREREWGETGKWCAIKCALRYATMWHGLKDAATHATFNQLLIIVLEPSRCTWRRSQRDLQQQRQLNCFTHTTNADIYIHMCVYMYIKLNIHVHMLVQLSALAAAAAAASFS